MLKCYTLAFNCQNLFRVLSKYHHYETTNVKHKSLPNYLFQSILNCTKKKQKKKKQSNNFRLFVCVILILRPFFLLFRNILFKHFWIDLYESRKKYVRFNLIKLGLCAIYFLLNRTNEQKKMTTNLALELQNQLSVARSEIKNLR